MHLGHGGGAYWEDKWFQLRWEDYPGFKDACIVAKEQLPIVAAAAVWGTGWQGKRIQLNWDNMVVVSILSSGYCKEKFMAYMLRCFISWKLGMISPLLLNTYQE